MIFIFLKEQVLLQEKDKGILKLESSVPQKSYTFL